MTISQTPPLTTPKRSKLEGIKERSHGLREPVATELLEDTTRFTEDGVQILKFHGSYQQDNRDNRIKGQEKDYQFMLRTRSPGGFIPPQLYLTLDRLADQYGNGTLRATDRQGIQLHGVLKKNLKAVFAAIIKNMGSTLGACGDLNRNVMAPPAPYKNRREYEYASSYANHIADLLTPQSGAYYEIWLDGEKVISGEEDPAVKAARHQGSNGTIFPNHSEPIYGDHYMPRKFKISVTVPGDNSVDLYTQDLSLVVITDGAGELEGFNLFVGGGMGRTHNKEETFARIADPLGFVPKEDVYEAVKAIVATQRDYGDRETRRHARMKYLIHDWGVDKFRAKVEEYWGKPFQPSRPLPPWKYLDFLGWHEQGDGKLFLGISIDNGRIKDDGPWQLKSALRQIVERYHIPMRVTPNQNVLLYEIEPNHQSEIERILSQAGIQKERELEPLARHAIACPALPTCGLAITESERVIPRILDQIRVLLDNVGLEQEHFVVRMTGCPNGCARPYMAELGFVGSAPDAYQLWLGGSPEQTRLAQPYMDRLHVNDLEATLEPMFVYFKQNRHQSESFGDFCHRVGFDSIRQFVNNYQSVASMNTEINNVTMTSMNTNDQFVTPSQPATTRSEPTSTQPASSFSQNPVSPTSVGPTAHPGVPMTPDTSAGMPQGDGAGKVDNTKIRRRVSVRDEIYTQLKSESQRLGKPVVQLATEAIEQYLQKLKTEQQ